MTDQQKAEMKIEAAREAKRLVAACRIACVAAAFGAVMQTAILVLASVPGPHPVSLVLEPLLAATLGTAVVSCARALDGPIKIGGRGRETTSSSSAASLISLWIACFVAIEASFLVIGIVDRWEAGRAECTADAGETLRGELTIQGSKGRRTLAVTACGAGKATVDDVAAETPKGNSTANVSPDNDGDPQ